MGKKLNSPLSFKGLLVYVWEYKRTFYRKCKLAVSVCCVRMKNTEKYFVNPEWEKMLCIHLKNSIYFGVQILNKQYEPFTIYHFIENQTFSSVLLFYLSSHFTRTTVAHSLVCLHSNWNILFIVHQFKNLNYIYTFSMNMLIIHSLHFHTL